MREEIVTIHLVRRKQLEGNNLNPIIKSDDKNSSPLPFYSSTVHQRRALFTNHLIIPTLGRIKLANR